MKTNTLTKLVGLFILISIFSCKKYEDGPGISFRTKKARITGQWKVDKIFSSSGNEQTLTNEDKEEVLEIKKDNTLSGIGTSEGCGQLKISGKWEFTNKKKNVKFDVTVQGTCDGFGINFSEVAELEILRLTNKDLWVKDKDGDKTYYKKQ